MFGLLNLSQYLPVLILAYFGLSSAAKVQEGDLNTISDLFDRGLQQGPVFVKEPKDRYFVVKGYPSILECLAQGAVHISFKCAGSWIKQRDHTNNFFIDPITQKETLHSSIYVSREDVEDYYGSDGFWCECYASDHKSETPGANIVKSQKGFVELAYLKKRFEREPVGVRVELKQQTLLQCLPPEGKPLPEVFWLKDGQQIDVKGDINFIISSEGSLIINQARLLDTGNYTCGAQNIVTRRLSHTVTLTVFVNGGWSSWSKWTACSVSCGSGWQHRERTCTNPTPIGGGEDCHGESILRTSCKSICPVDGVWAEWSSWSTCNADCVHHRQRSCDSPSPANGGKYCAGTDRDTLNCSTGICKDALHEDVTKTTGSVVDKVGGTKTVTDNIGLGYVDPSNHGHGVSTETTGTHEAENNENMAIYIGLCVAIAVFIILIVIIILIVKRRKRQLPNNRNNIPNGGLSNHTQGNDGKKFKTDNLLLAQSDPTHYAAVKPLYMHSSNNSHTPTYDDQPMYAEVGNVRPNGLVLQTDIPNNMMTVDHSLSSPDDEPMTRIPANQNRNHAKNTVIVSPILPYPSVLDDSLEVDDKTNNLRDSRSSGMSELPSQTETEAVTWSRFDHRGGRLTLPESGVSLLIPEGAVRHGHTEEIYMAVCRDDKDRPRLSDNQTILSPVVLCGPTDLVLLKPVVLSLQHCASMRQAGWKLLVCSSHTPPDEPPQWQSCVTLGQEDINTEVYTQLDATHCHIMTEQLQRYTLIGEPALQGKAVKILRLAAFAPALPPSMDYSIRVYVVEDTPDALQGVMQMERRLHGRLLDKPKQIPFQDGGQNLCLTIEELAPGWRSKLAANYQEIPFGHIWSGNQNNLHCSFSLEMVDRAQDAINCLIQVYQKAILSNRQVLKINANFKQPPTTMCSPASSSNKCQSSTVMNDSASGVSSIMSCDGSPGAPRLPSHIRNQLCQMLDKPCVRGNDWRMLAQALSVDRYANYFATKSSPTEHIINLWEAIYREESAVTDLMNILRVMGRMDAAGLLEKDVGAWL